MGLNKVKGGFDEKFGGSSNEIYKRIKKITGRKCKRKEKQNGDEVKDNTERMDI